MILRRKIDMSTILEEHLMLGLYLNFYSNFDAILVTGGLLKFPTFGTCAPAVNI